MASSSSMILILTVCAALLHHAVGQAAVPYRWIYIWDIPTTGGTLDINAATSSKVVFEPGTSTETFKATEKIYHWYKEDSQSTFLMPTNPQIYSDVLHLTLEFLNGSVLVPLKPVKWIQKISNTKVVDPSAPTSRRATTSVIVQDVITGMWYNKTGNSWINLRECNYTHSTNPKILECTVPVETFKSPGYSGYYVAMRLTYEQVIEYANDDLQPPKLDTWTIVILVAGAVLTVTGLGLVCSQCMRKQHYSAVEDDL